MTSTTEKISTTVIVQSLKKEANKILKKLETIAVSSQSDYDKLASYIKELKGYKKIAEEKESKIVSPLKEAIKETQLLFKPFYSDINTKELEAKNVMLDFIDEQEAKKLKLEHALQDGKIKKVSTYMEKATALEVTSGGGVFIASRLETIIEDVSKIPREYMVPDMSAIKAAFKEGKKIPGCIQVKEKSIRI